MVSSSKRVARIAEFQREQTQRIAARLQRNIDDFERLAANLDLEIRTEEKRTRNSDPSHVAYSMRAKTARARRDNLRRSRDELSLHLRAIHAVLDEAPDKQSAA
jgi:flagellar FliJ protein